MPPATRFEVVFRGETHGPFLPLEAVAFVHGNGIPLNAAVRVAGQKRLWPLRRFPRLAQAATLAAKGLPLPPVNALGSGLRDGAEYTPNHLSALERFAALFWAAGLIGFSIVGWSRGEIPVVGGKGAGVMVGGAGLWVMLSANLLLAAAALVAVVDHYDRRNNERQYRRAFGILGIAGVGALILGVVLGVDHSRLSSTPRAGPDGMRSARLAEAGSTPFRMLPMAVGHDFATVYVVATRNCSRDASLRADRLAAGLRERGIAVERVQDVSFGNLQAAQVPQINAVMGGPLPIVFVAGAAANNPTLEAVLAQRQGQGR
jgi:hypothetical protein